MGWFTKSPPPIVRRVVSGAKVAEIVKEAFKPYSVDKEKGIRLFILKENQLTITRKDLEEAAFVAYRPWRKDGWECEDQARAMIHELQLKASKGPVSYAVGVVRGNSPTGFDNELHMYVWGITEVDVAGVKKLQLLVWDATRKQEVNLRELSGLDFGVS